MTFTRPVRRSLLALHVTVSVGWLGVTLCLLALAVTANATGSAAAAEGAYRSMKVFGDWLVLPLAFLSLVSGTLLALGTKWGLARHRWVWTKFWLTLAATAASVFALRPEIDAAAGSVAGGPAHDPSNLLVGPSVSLGIYVFCTVVSVLKPWGLTRRGRRLRPAAVRRAPEAPRRVRSAA